MSTMRRLPSTCDRMRRKLGDVDLFEINEAFAMVPMAAIRDPQHLQAVVPDAKAADRFVHEAMEQARAVDANDILYSLQSSSDYNPQPGSASIHARVYALNFSDDAFNPVELHTLEQLIPQIPHARYAIQEGTSSSFGHLTMAHPDLWAAHVAAFMHDLEDAAK